MHLIVEQRVDETGIYMRDSGKREFFITADQLKAMSEADVKNAIKGALDRSVETDKMTLSGDAATGKPLEFQFGADV